MIRPNEAAGLTAALAQAIHQHANDLTTLLCNQVYRAQLSALNLTGHAHIALTDLASAENSLRAIAAGLDQPQPAAAAPAAIAEPADGEVQP